MDGNRIGEGILILLPSNSVALDSALPFGGTALAPDIAHALAAIGFRAFRTDQAHDMTGALRTDPRWPGRWCSRDAGVASNGQAPSKSCAFSCLTEMRDPVTLSQFSRFSGFSIARGGSPSPFPVRCTADGFA